MVFINCCFLLQNSTYLFKPSHCFFVLTVPRLIPSRNKVIPTEEIVACSFLLLVFRMIPNFGACRLLTNSLHCFPFTCLHTSLAFMSYSVIARNSVCASCTRPAFLHPPSFGIILLFNNNEVIAYRCYAHGSSVPRFGAPWLGLSMAPAHLRKLGCRWSCLDSGACGGL